MCTTTSQQIQTDFPLFQELDIPVLEKLFETKQECYFEPGDILFSQGEKGKGVYCIKEGIVKLTKNYRKDQLLINLANEGYVLGLQAMSGDDHCYTLTASAFVPVKAYYISRLVFQETLRQFPAFAMKVMQNISNEISYIENKMHNITFDTGEQRVINTLQLLSHKFGLDERNAIPIHLSIKSIADLSAITAGHLYKILNEMESKGYITWSNQQIIIQNTDLLKNIS